MQDCRARKIYKIVDVTSLLTAADFHKRNKRIFDHITKSLETMDTDLLALWVDQLEDMVQVARDCYLIAAEREDNYYNNVDQFF